MFVVDENGEEDGCDAGRVNEGERDMGKGQAPGVILCEEEERRCRVSYPHQNTSLDRYFRGVAGHVPP